MNRISRHCQVFGLESGSDFPLPQAGSSMSEGNDWTSSSANTSPESASWEIQELGPSRLWHGEPSDKFLSRSNLATTPSNTSLKTVRLLQEMRAKNERLERLLRSALNDVKELKEKEALALSQGNEVLPFNQFKMHSLSASQWPRVIPAVAMISISDERPGEIVQCNETFKQLVGRSWEELMTGFTCCKLFPQRLLAPLLEEFHAMRAGLITSSERDLPILRSDGEEIQCRAWYNVISDKQNKPIYKMFYAVPL